MTDNIDIYRAAKMLIKKYGDDALLRTATRADELLEAGDAEGQMTYLRIIDAIRKLQNLEPGKAVH